MSIENYLTPYFKIPEQKVAEWKISATKADESLIFWILKNKKINSDVYGEWAFKKYKLPRLKVSFFHKHKVDEAILKKYHGFWPEHVLPIKEWKGVLYLACLEPIHSLDLPQEYQWILVPIEGILLWKQKTHINQKDMTRSISLSQLSYPGLAKTETLKNFPHSREITKTEELKDSHQKQPAQTGLENVHFGQIHLPLQKTSKEKTTPVRKSESTQDVHQMKKPAISSSLLKTSNKTPSPLPKVSHSSQMKTQTQIKTTESKISPVVPSISSIKKKTSPLHITPPSSIQKKPSLISTPPQKEPIQSNEPKNQEHEKIYKDILNHINTFFDRSMLLLLKNNVLKPWKWDQSWPKQPSTHNVILLNKPSVFRIVYKTKQKYHGYVVPNPVNDTFFQIWNEGKYPEHLTLLPLLNEDKKIKGMLLGMTSKVKGQSILLDKLDVLAIDISEKINNSRLFPL